MLYPLELRMKKGRFRQLMLMGRPFLLYRHIVTVNFTDRCVNISDIFIRLLFREYGFVRVLRIWGEK